MELTPSLRARVINTSASVENGCKTEIALRQGAAERTAVKR